MNVYLLCTAILTIAYFLLAFNVSMARGKAKVGIGTDANLSGPLNKSIRAHGNASEYIPLFVILFLYFNAAGVHGWVEWVVVAATASRLLHAVGIFVSPDLQRPQVFRFVGSLGTYLSGLALGVAVLTRAL